MKIRLEEVQTIVFHSLGGKKSLGVYEVNFIGIFPKKMSVIVSIDEVQKWVELTWGVV